MSDKEFGSESIALSELHVYKPLTRFIDSDDLSLPKATVQKIINEVLANDSGMAFAKESRDLLIECCVEFITMISSEANEIAEKDAKKTIACEHITKALEELGFGEYVPDLLEVAQTFKTQQVVGTKRMQD